ncbi:MAG: metallophosphoesterase [Myxococcales bacterium]|nr:metallophosphoesterase [Myxococcales bacterium]
MRATFCAILLIALGCDRGHPRDGTPPPTTTPVPAASSTPPVAPSAPASDGCGLPAVPERMPAPNRLVAIGDLHGDLAATKSALRAAGAIDASDRWSGGDLVVVQTGDVLDRGDDEQAVFDLLFRLEAEARAAGGALVLLMGNHELMNAAGDFRYVTPGAMTDFDDVPGLSVERWARAPEGIRRRLAALGPGGVYAKKLAAHNVVVIIGDTVFSHAGVIGEWATQVAAINGTSRCWLDGQGPADPPPALTSQDSPVWTRAYGQDEVDCGQLTSTLAALGARRMVVGHTVQKTINAACDGAVWRIDVGLARNYGGPIEVLEVLPTPRVLRSTR